MFSEACEGDFPASKGKESDFRSAPLLGATVRRLQRPEGNILCPRSPGGRLPPVTGGAAISRRAAGRRCRRPLCGAAPPPLPEVTRGPAAALARGAERGRGAPGCQRDEAAPPGPPPLPPPGRAALPAPWRLRGRPGPQLPAPPPPPAPRR